MAYNKTLIYEQAKELILKNKLFFVEDIVALLGISKPTFYDFFKVDSNEFNELSKMLNENKAKIKVSMRKKWHESDNATLQMALMKLICTDDERKKLSMTYTENESNVKVKVDQYEELTDEQLKAEIERLSKK
jgi:hypothetical protein